MANFWLQTATIARDEKNSPFRFVFREIRGLTWFSEEGGGMSRKV
jgi:hypothetical protein